MVDGHLEELLNEILAAAFWTGWRDLRGVTRKQGAVIVIVIDESIE